jgi:phage terminase large subunit-like protein
MNLHLPELLEWQKHFFERVESALSAGERIFVLNVGRQAGKTSALLLWALMWERGALAGGHVGFCAPSDKHLADVKDKMKRYVGELITGPSPAGLGYDLSTGGRVDFWALGFGAIAAGRGRSYQAVVIDEASYVPNLASVMEANLMPTLATTDGPTICGSTPDGLNNDYHDLWRRAPKRARYCGGSDLNPAISEEWLAEKRRTMTELRYLQEIEAVFCDVAGLKLKRAEVRYGRPPELSSFQTISFGIDPATSVKTSADYTALAVCGIDAIGRRWLLHLAHWRLSWGETEMKLMGYYDAWRPQVVIFEAVNFAALGCRALLNAGMAVRPIVPHKDKMTRFERLHVRYQMGDIWHSESLDSECENELYAFDSGTHDDVVDAAVYGFTPLFAELSTDWSEDNTSGRYWGHTLPHEKPVPKLYHGDGSYLQDVASESGETVMEHFNPDGSVYTDTWRLERIGDHVVVFVDDQEIGGYPRHAEPMLRAQHQAEYEERYAGRSPKTH